MTLRAATNAAHHCSADVVIEAAQTHCHTDVLNQPVCGDVLRVVQTSCTRHSVDRACLWVVLAGCPFRLELVPLPLYRWHCDSAELVQNWPFWSFCLWPKHLCVVGLTVLNILPLTSIGVAVMTQCMAQCSVLNICLWVHACEQWTFKTTLCKPYKSARLQCHSTACASLLQPIGFVLLQRPWAHIHELCIQMWKQVSARRCS